MPSAFSLRRRCLPRRSAGTPPDLRFEVASLKPSTAEGTGYGIRPAPGGQRYVAVNCPIKLMIQVAYRVKADQITGGPGWLDTERFDMEAKAEKPSSGDELHVMLMNMLVDRLQLKFHREKREMPMYALTVRQRRTKAANAARGRERRRTLDRSESGEVPAHKNEGDQRADGLFCVSPVPADGLAGSGPDQPARGLRFQSGVHARSAARISGGRED